jgi:hypothetical protein
MSDVQVTGIAAAATSTWQLCLSYLACLVCLARDYMIY